MSSQRIFLLGATGYVGSELLILLAQDLPEHHVVALVRNATPERIDSLKAIHPNISVVEGTLEDAEVIEKESEVADIIGAAQFWPVKLSSQTRAGQTLRSDAGGVGKSPATSRTPHHRVVLTGRRILYKLSNAVCIH